MTKFGVRFAVSSPEHFQALRNVFLEVKKDKDRDLFRDPSAWTELVPHEVKAKFDWPTDAERRAWSTARPDTPIAVDLPSLQLGGRWDFYSVFEAFQDGDYTLESCEMIEGDIAEMHIDPHGYPYGGVGPMIALAEAFGCEVIGVNECGRYELRTELVASSR